MELQLRVLDRTLTMDLPNAMVQRTGVYAETGPQRVHCSKRTLGELFSKQLQMHRVIMGSARAQVSVPGSSSETAYVTDCWKTLNANSCAACLRNASASMLGCLPWSAGRALYTGCFMRYSDTNFLNAISTSGGSSSRGKVVVIVIVVSSVIVLGVGAFIGIGVWKSKQIQKKRKEIVDKVDEKPYQLGVQDTLVDRRVGSRGASLEEFSDSSYGAVSGGRSISEEDKVGCQHSYTNPGANDVEKLVEILYGFSLNFKYSTLDKATGSFDEANRLGQGGFGTVYKLLRTESLLVYEFLPNQSLDRFIFDPIKGRDLNREKRFEIIIGTAEGLIYLHENSKTRKIHRDIKASNILLDSRFRAKIADFGLARSFQDDKSHISTALAGTLGYMAPEYLARGQLTEKADVYRFGVLLLEIVTGRQSNQRNNAMFFKKDEELPPPTKPPFVDEKTMQLHYRSLEQGDSATTANLSHSSFYPR
ncbi:Cysteine-rich receptor-like protein kinase 2 [Capsicum annuum]|nr:Cysteine-rich receptor-like protein kinase 2 [Capsicum annuum]